ncbi:MAG: DUF547 domain-containing protein [Desulfobacteraceae bacterium]|jgi:hypothetical protein
MKKSSRFQPLDTLRLFIAFFFLSAILAIIAPQAWAAPKVDNRLYAELLAKHVRGGLVDYASFKTERAKLKEYLEYLAGINPDDLSRDDAFAYYINLYNAATIDLVLENYPGIDSIKDIGGIFGNPWKIEFITLKGKKVHLDHVEHEILRPLYQDPRLHFAVNCASLGCPPLHDKPFEGETLGATLDELTRQNMADPAHTRLEGDDLYVSKVFDWFGEDWGKTEDKVAFVQKYSSREQAAKIDRLGGRLNLKYSEWDWTLNDPEFKNIS